VPAKPESADWIAEPGASLNDDGNGEVLLGDLLKVILAGTYPG
jgi:hypothetical protein